MAFTLSSARSQSLPKSSFVGCLRNFQVDLKPLDAPSARVGVSPCLAGSLEKGVYFSQEGGHVTLGEEPWGRGGVFEPEELHPFSRMTRF